MRRLLFTGLIFSAVTLHGQSIVHLHGELADANAIFFGARFFSLSVDEGFSAFLPEIYADYVLPPLPLSLGLFFKTPDINLKSFGGRAGLHIDFDSPKFDLYLLYVFDLGFIRAEELAAVGDYVEPMRLYDFRAGLRYIFGAFICIEIETLYKMQGVSASVSLKLN